MIIIRVIACVYIVAITYNNLVREVRNSKVFKDYKYVKDYISALDNEINK